VEKDSLSERAFLTSRKRLEEKNSRWGALAREGDHDSGKEREGREMSNRAGSLGDGTLEG